MAIHPSGEALRGVVKGASLAALLVATPAGAAGAQIDIRCPALSAVSQEELRARSALLLYGAGMYQATLALECTSDGADLVWVDGSRTRLKGGSGWVEGALDAIEEKLAHRVAPPSGPGAEPPAVQASQPRRQPVAHSSTELPSTESAALEPELEPGEKAGAARPVKQGSASEAKGGLRSGFDGGVGFRTMTEFWSGSLGVGPQLEVGVGPDGPLALVVGEGARFGVGPSDSGTIMLFNLQVGVAYGTPFKHGTGLGLALLGGTERIAATGSSGASWLWTATGTLGLRASIDTGPFLLLLGAESTLRSASFEISGVEQTAIPTLSGILSLGCFFPASTPKF